MTTNGVYSILSKKEDAHDGPIFCGVYALTNVTGDPKFYNKFHIPGVLGCIDGTHVAILRPITHEERYYNRKGYHSLNVMIICDSDLNILCVDASSPGSAHDSMVWQGHPLSSHLTALSNANEHVFLLGDSGYPLRPTMMTPILNTQEGSAEYFYYQRHVAARNVVERCIGLLKARFRDKYKQFLVTGGLDSLVKVWKIENDKLELFHTLKGHGMGVVSIDVSPDGHTIASASLDSTLIIWELVSGLKVHEIEKKATNVWKVVFSPDGMQVATGGHTGKVVLYDVAKGKEVRMLDTRGKFAMSIAWSPNGKYIAAGSVDGKVYVFDVAQGKLIHTVDGHTDSVRNLVFSYNSKLLATASHDGRVNVYDTASGNLQKSVDHKGWVVCVCFTRDGYRIATGTVDGTVRVIHLAEMNVLHAFHEHNNVAWSVQFNYDGNKLISVSKDNTINIYECPIIKNNNEKKIKT